MQLATMGTAERLEPLNATIDEVAAHLKISTRTVQLYQERGLLRPVYFGKLRRFRWKDLRQLEKTGVEAR